MVTGNKGPCKVDECEAPATKAGMCEMHYGREWRAKQPKVPCSVQGCERFVSALGLCDRHYARLRRTGAIGVPESLVPRGVFHPCAVDGCEAKATCRGWCGNHYNLWRRYGKPAGPAFEERFWARTDKNGPVPDFRPELGPCWIWEGAQDGYKRYGVTRRSMAHRVAYELAVGPIPDGLEIDHLCKVTLCVNPSHLEPVTRTENIRRSDSPGGRWGARTECHICGGPLVPGLGRQARRCIECDRRRSREGGLRRRAAAKAQPSLSTHIDYQTSRQN